MNKMSAKWLGPFYDHQQDRKTRLSSEAKRWESETYHINYLKKDVDSNGRETLASERHELAPVMTVDDEGVQIRGQPNGR